FCNGLDELLRHAQLWVHGHLHCPVDYLKRGVHEGQPWQCRVVANPRGYFSKGEQETFVEQFVIDLD
ncbi:MAG: metallophosphoesterase, partial [Aquabacterium sp.]|nr:metallophosphoesterase [Aquabacterium sp.]